jgi:hypothetical protein
MNCAPTPTAAAATMAAATVPAAGCTRRRLIVERSALTVVIVSFACWWPRYVSQDCSTRAAFSSTLATKLVEENRNSRMVVSRNTGRRRLDGDLATRGSSSAPKRTCRLLELWAGELTNASLAPFTCGTLVSRKPFTVTYAKGRAAQEYWER